MNNTRLKEILDKYLEGTASVEETVEVDNWYRSFDDREGLTEQLDAEQLAALEQLFFLRVSNGVLEAEAGGRVIRRNFRYWWAAAAIAAMLIAGGVYVAVNRSSKPQVALTTVTEQTGRGVIKKIQLPDGSVVWLNFDSRVRYMEQHSREVWLEGEGYFEVEQQQGKPFLVHAGKLDVQVLGTRFNIDAYTPGESVIVTVAAGKVAVGNDRTDRTTLAANQQAVYQSATGKIVTSTINAVDFLSWREFQLVFKAETFSHIARKLERRYNVRIRFAGEHIASSVLTASFDVNVPLKDVLDMMCDIYGFNYRMEKGNEYVIFDGQSK